MAQFDPERAAKDGKKLAIEIEVYMQGMQNKRHMAILVITAGVLVMMYKISKEMVMFPVRVDDIETLLLAETVPSAAAFHFKSQVEARLGFSHLIIESPSLILLMRYTIIRGYLQDRIDFCDEFKMQRDAS